MTQVPGSAKIQPAAGTVSGQDEQAASIHPNWQAVIRFCEDMGYGEIACLKIHDGLPISAEVVTRKIRWS